MPYSLEQRTLVLGLFVRTGFVKLKSEKFMEQYTAASVPKKLTVQQLVRKWHSNSSANSAREHVVCLKSSVNGTRKQTKQKIQTN
jgi:hypothetical protein